MLTGHFPYCRTGLLTLSVAIAAALAFWFAHLEIIPSHEASVGSVPAESEAPSFVMDATVPDIVADYLRDHPNPHVRIFTRRSAKNTSL